MDEDVQYVGMRLPPIDFPDGTYAARRSGTGGSSGGVQPRMDTYGGQLALERLGWHPAAAATATATASLRGVAVGPPGASFPSPSPSPSLSSLSLFPSSSSSPLYRAGARMDVLTTVLAGITLAVQRRADQAPYDVSFHRSGGGTVEIGRKSSSSSSSRSGGGGGRTTNTERYAVFACQVVSAKHAKMVFTNGGQVYLVDLDSRHGTHLLKRGEDISHTIQPGVETALDDGDIVTFGKTVGAGRQMVEPVTVRVKLLRRTVRTTATAVGASSDAAAAGTDKNPIMLSGYPSDSDSSTSLPSPPRADKRGSVEDRSHRDIYAELFQNDGKGGGEGGGLKRIGSAGRYGLFEPPSEPERSSDGENEHEHENEEGDKPAQRSEHHSASAAPATATADATARENSPAMPMPMPTFSFDGADGQIDVEDWRSTLHEPLFGDLLPKDVDADYLIDEPDHERERALDAFEAEAQEQEEDDDEDEEEGEEEEEDEDEDEEEEEGPVISRLETPSEMDMGTPAPALSAAGDEAQSEADMDMETPREQSRASSHSHFDLHLPDVPTHHPELLFEPSVEPEEITLISAGAAASFAGQDEGQSNKLQEILKDGVGTAMGEQVAREDLPSLRTIFSDITPTPFGRDTIPVANASRAQSVGSPVERHVSVPVSDASAGDSSADDEDEDDEMGNEADRAAISELQASCEHIQTELGELYSSVDALENDVNTVSEDLEDVHAHFERLDRLSDTSLGRLQAVESRLSALAGVKTQVEGLQARVDAVAAMPQPSQEDKEDKEVYMKELRETARDLNDVVADIRELHRETKQRLAGAVEEILAARKEALAEIQSEVQAFKTLKRKRSDSDMTDGEVADVTSQLDVTAVTAAQPHPASIIIQAPPPPPRKRMRRVLSLTARTATAVAFGAVATWSALAFS
ncbi:hypothetical protein CONPUDRAFT_84117 [Coniophora puteana RWD-64-598 SS2]|uniref:FHA domain-containing protein n=1 Tax=Coniophora puteana (strain RWD-64-598) TaxID=741705 RepID=A0A5M3MG49_CONPW|nr:uncharacterized protein CONPUDRAFT_84117 [Coniophora puteana RWD-64-598 SS2]EIW77734.1 hypothetical protein CONPUDRAFT_84117 [Coniophora puteana RWD-64-598 SS2]